MLRYGTITSLLLAALLWSASASALPLLTLAYQACVVGLSSLAVHAPLPPQERKQQRDQERRRFHAFTSWWYGENGYRGPRSIRRDELPVNLPELFEKYRAVWEAKLPRGTRLDPQAMTGTVYDLRDFTNDPRRFFNASQRLMNRIEARAFEKKIGLREAFREIVREVLVEGGFPPEIVDAGTTYTSDFRARLAYGMLFHDSVLKNSSFHGANYHLWQWLAYIQDREDALALPPPGTLRAVYMSFGHNPLIDELKWGNPDKGTNWDGSGYSPWLYLFDMSWGRGFYHPERGNLWLRYFIRGMTDVLDGTPY